MRKSSVFTVLVVFLALLLGLMFVHAFRTRKDGAALFTEKRELVKALCLTDLCIFTDARYTRHPTMADLHSPFQDYPVSLEHFPSASIMSVPPHLRSPGRN
jgi:hypothetical protein